MSVWVAGAVVVGGVASAAISSNSAKKAANTQAASTAAGISSQDRQFEQTRADQLAQYDQTRADFAPYRAAGTQALGQYQTELNGNTSAADVMAAPGYQFGLQQGQQALDRKAAASGGRVSGASLKQAAEYATNYATTGYNAEYQRRQDRLNRLAVLATVGQTATGASAVAGANSTNAIGMAGQNYANNVTGLMTAQGNASAAGQLAQGNIWGNTVNQLGAAGQRWASTPSQTSTPAASSASNLEWA
jgi:hypothetical protein